MKEIAIFNVFTAEERMTRIGGERLRVLILKETDGGEKIALQFAGKAIASVSFLDEGLAKLLLEGWSMKQYQARVQLIDIHPRDKKILDDLLRERAKGV